MDGSGRLCLRHNALAESFVATLKTELLYRSSWPTRQAARTAILEYIEGYYDRAC
ncbi:MAG: integrase core domain-containing protein [Actinobacteria bacterium]|nr:integrase core domain-containing protein [Actinomycetota bacterium]